MQSEEFSSLQIGNIYRRKIGWLGMGDVNQPVGKYCLVGLTVSSSVVQTLWRGGSGGRLGVGWSCGQVMNYHSSGSLPTVYPTVCTLLTVLLNPFHGSFNHKWLLPFRWQEAKGIKNSQNNCDKMAYCCSPESPSVLSSTSIRSFLSSIGSM